MPLVNNGSLWEHELIVKKEYPSNRSVGPMTVTANMNTGFGWRGCGLRLILIRTNGADICAFT